MRLHALGWVLGAVILLPGLAFAQYGYVPECAETVANRLNVSTLDVRAELGPFSANGNRIVTWRARRASDRYGYCEFNTATGELVRAESGDYRGPVSHRRFEAGSPGEGGMYRQTIVEAPRVKVDTGGRGEFIGLRKKVRIKRGWVDTKGQQTTVALSGGDDFKIDFYGRLIQQNGNDEFTMEIDSSNRGEVRGTATFRLTPNHKEVETISASGQLNGRDFSGTFRR